MIRCLSVLCSLLVAFTLSSCGRPPGGGPQANQKPVEEVFASIESGVILSAVSAPSAGTTPVEGKLLTPNEETGWPTWRGPNRNGVAPGVNPPLKWSARENILWSAQLPGRGHGSPCIYDGKVIVATADEINQQQGLFAYDADNGKVLWRVEVSRGGFPGQREMHHESTHASCTPACDGELVFVAFLHHNSVQVSAYTLDGKKAWGEVNVGSFRSKFGYAPSPSLYGPYVVIAADHQGGGYLAALDRKTGEIKWRRRRPAVSSYASPLIANVAGKDQLLMAGCDQIASFDPATGDPTWSVSGTSSACTGTVVYEDGLVASSGGFPDRETMVVSADGSRDVLWRKSVKAYVPSMLLHDGLLYLVSDDGRSLCIDAKTGEEKWRTRLQGKLFRASPVWVDDHVLISNNEGLTYVFKATGDSYQQVAANKLGTETYASPAIVGDRIYLRVASGSGGNRQETLYCVGEG
ncbi:outer membrane protein assembly factor BamB family protein [Calycomorphotria hydatis]|uniref:Outer membrane biogenesis protein BamB n=1 Tax=Calycomorphotria hydatis TaxID=2528027 RepID=A0A517TDZ6_9PLAN|nr:PQQ-binding-like beta-propeller repeat protein [Calycomorphotria hydatis]QDT66595.1 outer membrane biogenesis protein BamB [Calycomorphotria hydatis]